MKLLLACVICSIVSSIVTTKILATHYFKLVDGYVDEISNKTKEFVELAETRIHKQG